MGDWIHLTVVMDQVLACCELGHESVHMRGLYVFVFRSKEFSLTAAWRHYLQLFLTLAVNECE